MKKILTLILVFALSLVSLFAGEEKDDFLKDYSTNPAAYTNIGKRFKPTNVESLGMGGAGVALTDSSSAIFYNPAGLSEGKFSLSVPSFGITLYHPSALLEKGEDGKSLVEKVMKGEKMGELVTPVLDVIGTSFTPLVRADAEVSLVLPFGLGIGVYTSDTVYTYSGTVINEVDASLALGYAYKVRLGSLNISTGVAARFNALAFNRRLDAIDLSDVIDSKDIKNMELTLASGWAPLLDLGITTEWHGLSVAAVLSEINLTGYKMQIDATTVSKMAGTVLTLDKNNDLTIKGIPNLTFGLGYKLDSKFISLKAGVDFTDCIPFINKDIELNKRTAIKHLNAGLELGLFDTLILRGGLNSGYYTAGASLDFYALRIDAAYYWMEMGTGAGERGVDGLSIRFNIGYDR